MSFVPPEDDSDSNRGYRSLSMLSSMDIDLLYPGKLTNLKICKNFHFGKNLNICLVCMIRDFEKRIDNN